jgi:hypothetical protein
VKTLALLALTAAMVIPAGEATAASPQPHGPAGSWNLIWHDEFTGDILDTAKWTQPGWHVQNVDTKPGNAWVYDGRLTLNLSSADQGALVRSVFRFRPGMVAEARVRFPGSDTGDHIFNFPAWWAAGIRYPDSGEHDIAEGVTKGLKVSYWDGDRELRHGSYPAGDWNNAWHRFTLWRRSSDARVYWDGTLVASYPTHDDGGPQALILSLGATAGEPPVLGKPGRVWVDSVRVWSR